MPRLGVVEGARAADHQRHHGQQHEGPEAEDDLDLTEQVKQPGVAREAVTEAFDGLGREGVEQGQREDQGGRQVEVGHAASMASPTPAPSGSEAVRPFAHAAVQGVSTFVRLSPELRSMRLLYGSTPTHSGGWSTVTVTVCWPVFTRCRVKASTDLAV